MDKKKIIIANWKMNLNVAESINLTKDFTKKFKGFDQGEVVVCPNYLILSEISKMLNKTNISAGAQDVFWEEKGAFTGEISPASLLEVGAKFVIIGHSERRKYQLESYEMIHNKLRAVLNTEKLTPIVCLGESWEERKTDKRDIVLQNQLQLALGGLNIVGDQEIIVAYEPIWAIGTGTAMEPDEAEYSHKIIGLMINDMFGMKVAHHNFRIIYGGSISSKNVAPFAKIDYLDGLLVGSASLDTEEFYKVAKAITK